MRMAMKVLLIAAVLMSPMGAQSGEAPATEQPQALTHEQQLWKAQGALETQRDMLVNQANGQLEQINAQIKRNADELAKLKGGAPPPPAKGAK